MKIEGFFPLLDMWTVTSVNGTYYYAWDPRVFGTQK